MKILTSFNQGIGIIGSTAATIGLFFLVLSVPLPAKIGLAFRYDFLGIFFIVGITFFIIFRLPEKWRWPAGLCAVFILFALPLAGLWDSGVNEPNTVFGLLPWFDARGYYHEASGLLDGTQFTEISSRRPLFPGFLAVLLALTGRNLMFSLAILAAISAFTCWQVGNEINNRFGSLAGALTITLLFFFYRRFSGAILTELLGLSLAAAGFSILLHSIDHLKKSRLFLGILLLTLALNARAGAFFTLPLLILWSVWYFKRTSSWKTAWLYGLTSAGAVLVGFLLNYLLFLILASPNTQPFSNFSYTFYGLAAGGKGWTQVLTDHPEIGSLLENQRASRVYDLAFQEILTNPGQLFQGILSAWKAFLMPSASGVFGFAGRLYDSSGSIAETTIRLILMLLSFLVLVAWFRHKKNPLFSFLTFLTVGVLLSVPFAPPGDADRMRAYAASIPIIAALPAVGIGIVFSRKHNSNDLIPQLNKNGDNLIFYSGLFLAVIVSITPAVAFFLSTPPEMQPAVCPKGMDQVTIRINPGSMVFIQPDGQLKASHLPYLRQSDFLENLSGYPEEEILPDLAEITAPATIYNTTDLTTGEEIWLFARQIIQSGHQKTQVVCGRFDRNSNLRNLFRVDSILP